MFGEIGVKKIKVKKLVAIGYVLMCVAFFVAPAGAQPNQEQLKQAYDEAGKVQQKGPAEVSVLDQGQIKLPAKYTYIPQPQAGELMKSMGNRDNPDLVGLIFPLDNKENWFVAIKFVKSGYIKDDDAKDWNADKLLESIKEGTQEANKDRVKNGFPELEVLGWVENPKYDSTKHQLVWSISARTKGAKNDRQSINYNTYVLGREGYIILNFITDLKNIEQEKPIAAELLNATEFVSTKRYEDFNSVTDKVAEYGLAGLVAGVAAKKLGFFALAAAFGLKFGKIIVAVVAGIGVVVAKVLGRKKKGDSQDNDTPQPPAN